MIITVTPNPSIDRTVTLGGPLTRGAQRREHCARTPVDQLLSDAHHWLGIAACDSAFQFGGRHVGEAGEFCCVGLD